MASPVLYTLAPAAAAIAGAALAVWRRPGPGTISAVQHFAAGVVFAAAAGELLPDVLHRNSPWPTFIGGVAGVAVMLAVKQVESRTKGALGLVVLTGIDVLVDGVVLGMGFVAGAKAGLLLAIALTLEVFFLGLTAAIELHETTGSRARAVLLTAGLMLLLPAGALMSIPMGQAPVPVVTAFFSFSLIALLYLVTEELLVEAHERPDTPLVTAMFFFGFLALLLLEEAMA